MNTKLLLKVKAAILAEPREFDMRLFFNRNADSQCGTSACIAGHAVAIGEGLGLPEAQRKSGYFVETIAAKLLDIGSQGADILFYCAAWPSSFGRAYVKAQGDPHERAQVAAKRIDWFIKTEGRE